MPAIAHQNKILGNTSGGGSTILVTTSESSLYGQTVSLTDGTTTMNGTFSNTGECEFTGVMMVGTLTASSGGASTSIQVPYFGVYSMTLSFFSATITVTFSGGTCTCVGNGESYTASSSPYTFTVHGAATYTITNTIDGVSKTDTVTVTTDGQSESVTISFGTINVTYDNDFRGTSITCTQGGTTITKTAPSAGNTMSFYPPTTGTWVISGTVSGDTYNVNATVSSLSTPVPVTLETIPDGSTKTPTDDISIWLSCAGIKDKAYTTLSQVLSDSETFNALLGDSNACAYMARSTTWTTDICASQYAMSMIGQYDVCCDALLGNATWASAIAQSAYADYVCNVSVPKMTSNTTPSGTCFGSSIYSSSFDYYKAFDGSASGSDKWSAQSGQTTNQKLGYDFGTPKSVAVAKLTNETANSTQGVKNCILQYSDDGTTYQDASVQSTGVQGGTATIISTITTPHRYWQLDIIDNYGGANLSVMELQFYGHTSSNELIHGTNNESAYYLDGATQTPIVDPSTLSAGTYTFGSTVAKDPSDLTADYTKTIRITPNTKEIVLRPDNALYWWGYVSPIVEVISAANGWTTDVATIPPTFNDYNMSISTALNSNASGIGTKIKIDGISHVIMSATADYGGYYADIISTSQKITSSTYDIERTRVNSTSLAKYDSTTSVLRFLSFVGYYGMANTLYAMWH